jgi:hypothetical protein
VAAVVAPFLVASLYLFLTRWPSWHFTALTDYTGLAVSILVGAGFIATLPIQMRRRIFWLLIYVPASAILVFVFGSVLLFVWFGWVPVPRTPGPHDYTEQDVQRFITPGRPFVEITNRFGQPRLSSTNGPYLVWHFSSGLPDTRPEQGYVFAEFTLWTTNGQAAKWSATDWEKVGR